MPETRRWNSVSGEWRKVPVKGAVAFFMVESGGLLVMETSESD
jgi:hypothetical protein